MFQRIKDAIDRGIADEQAKATASAQARSRRSGSTSRNPKTDSPSRRARQPKPSLDLTKDAEGVANTDPSVFENAFVIDDSDEAIKNDVSQPSVSSADAKEETGSTKPQGTPLQSSRTPSVRGQEDESPAANGDGDQRTSSKGPSNPVPSVELPTEIRARLRKLDKMESTYKELLRSYRIAHGRATPVEAFEKALRENTPLTSIRDPDALVEYLQQINLKGDMVRDEFKRVSEEKEMLKKQNEADEKEITNLKDEIAALKLTPVAEPTATEPATTGHGVENKESPSHSRSTSLTKSPVAQVLGIFSPKQKLNAAEVAKGAKDSGSTEEFFSFESEIPNLQAELASKTDEIDTLKIEVQTLKENLETAKRASEAAATNISSSQLTKPGELQGDYSSLAQLEDLKTEHASLKTRHEKMQALIQETIARLAAQKQRAEEAEAALDGSRTLESFSTERATVLETEFEKLRLVSKDMEARISTYEVEVEQLTKSNRDAEIKIEQLSKGIAAADALGVDSDTPEAQPQTSSSKKKNKKKKKGSKTASTGQESTETGPLPRDSAIEPGSPAEDVAAIDAMRSRLAELETTVQQNSADVDRIAKLRSSNDDLREEVEGLREELVSIGQEHVTAKDRVKQLEQERSELKHRIAELEWKLESSKSATESNAASQADFGALMAEYETLKAKSSTLQTDLGAAQQLAQARYKDLTDMREMLQKIQPELKTLRQDSAALKAAKDEVAAKVAEIRTLEKQLKDVKTEMTRAQRLVSDREGEIKTLQDKLTAETNNRLRLEDAQRVSGRDLRRSEADKIELSAKEEKATRELQKAQEELSRMRARAAELETEGEKLRKSSTLLSEEAELKASQYSNAQGLLSSMRDQTAELSVRLKESRSQAESLEEELGECQKLLTERTREAETMRRLLSDADTRADARLRDLRSRLEAATEERDRIEQESSALARRRARELEELRGRTRELERDSKGLAREKDEAEAAEKESRRRRDELEQTVERDRAEAEEARGAVASLKQALDTAEKQARDADKQKVDLRRLLEEARGRYDRLYKEVKGAPGRLAATSSNTSIVASSSRSSIDSVRSGAVGAVGANGGTVATPSADATYLKTILLQFLEQKDNKLRAQLVPVLGKLLLFDKHDEKKWQAAVQQLGAK